MEPAVRLNTLAATEVDVSKPPTATLGTTQRGEKAERAECEAFVAAEYGRVYAWFVGQTGRAERAADLTQETFAAFWESARRRRLREPAAWLMRIARNRWRKFARGERQQAARSEDCADAALRIADGRAEQSLSSAGHAAVRAAVAELPVRYREAVVLRFWCDYSFGEIGRILGVPAVLARWRVHRGRTMLREKLETHEIRAEV